MEICGAVIITFRRGRLASVFSLLTVKGFIFAARALVKNPRHAAVGEMGSGSRAKIR